MKNHWVERSNSRKIRGVINFVQDTNRFPGHWNISQQSGINCDVLSFHFKRELCKKLRWACTVVKSGADSWDVRYIRVNGVSVIKLGRYGTSEFWNNLTMAIKSSLLHIQNIDVS